MKDKLPTNTENLIDLNKLKTLSKELKTKYNLSTKQLLEILEQSFKLIEKEDFIPTSIFQTKLAPLESLTKYLKENLNYNFSKIASLLNRDQRTIWSAYQSSKKKKFKLKIKSEILVPISIFSNRKFSILESLVKYLKDKYNFTFHKMALQLNRNDRTIWTVYSRAKRKTKTWIKT